VTLATGRSPPDPAVTRKPPSNGSSDPARAPPGGSRLFDVEGWVRRWEGALALAADLALAGSATVAGAAGNVVSGARILGRRHVVLAAGMGGFN
jgi:hypothetical protein